MSRRRLRTLTVALLGVVCLLALGATDRQSGEVQEEQWNAVYLNGQKSGHQHLVRRQLSEDGRTVHETTVDQTFTVRRGAMQIQLKLKSLVAEGADGRVLRFHTQLQQGPLSQQMEGRREGEEMVVRSGSGPSATTTRVPAPSGLGPWAQERLRAEKGFKPGTTYSFPAFLPEQPTADTTATVTVGSAEEIEVGGQIRELHRLDYQFSLLPGMNATEWVDDENTTWLSRVALGPGLVLELRLTDREGALGRDNPADIVLSALVQPDRRVVNPRQRDRLRLLISAREAGAKLPDLPQDAHQTVRRTEDGQIVTIRRAAPDPADSYDVPYAGQEHAELLRPNRWMELSDPGVKEMAREAAGAERDALRLARRIESYVAAQITRKDLSMGMATAAETARERTGDCTEHAVLVAALARAAGIPSRVVDGLAYVEDWPGVGATFGYHMWAEVWVGQWLPLDAALGGHDATHLALSRSDLNEPDALAGAIGIVPFLGRLRIQVLEPKPAPAG